ncbi:inositol monophosphatase family protein [Candidatus Bealeia paramacronuclearis]
MINAAFKAARGLVRDFGEVEHLQVSRKGPGDFVSVADKKSEKILFEELKKARPDFCFLMEESGRIENKDKDHTWIIDPLDGTSNFLHGIPHFSISIGLQKGNEIIAGVIYDPIKNEMFYAERGGGAFLNDRRIRVSARTHLADSLLATGIPFASTAEKDQKTFTQSLQALMPKVAGIRRMGSAALDLAYVASGRYEAYWEGSISSWDVAAGIIIVKEAGGFVRDLKGGTDVLGDSSILATNEGLQVELEKTLKAIYAK